MTSAAVPSWFVVLPDCPSAAPARTLLPATAHQRTRHPSGRPWMAGRWGDDAVMAEAGHTALAVIGQHEVTAGALTEAAARIRTLADVGPLYRSLRGSFHLVASVGGQVRVQGPVSCLRRVFHAYVGGAVVAADRADVLAGMTGAGPDRRRLAVHLLQPFSLHPVTDRPVWSGVSAVPAGHHLSLHRDGRAHRARWWTPPDPVVPMADGAAALREVLGAAVDVRTRDRPVLSADLGGVDSTAVCCLAARGASGLIAYTLASRDPHGDDALWARRTVAALGNIEHEVLPAEAVPYVYHGILDFDDPLDEPFPALVDHHRWLVIARAAAARGSRLHLTGFGGDELLGGSPAHLHAMLRRSPRSALRDLRGYAGLYRWPHRQALAQLLTDPPYRSWLARAGDDLLGPASEPDAPFLGWGIPARLPPWATRDAVRAVREAVHDAAPTAEPLAATHGLHQELGTMRAVTRVIRQLAQLAGRIGVTLAAPYYDDRVIETALAVRPGERVTPWRYKPLIAAAMRGIVPPESLTRVTKAEGSHDVHAGLSEHRKDLLALCEDSRLARLGLIDADLLRRTCERPLPPTLPYEVLYQTVACEVWLRTLERAGTPS
ncbi:asparagine synthase-related protein [Streptomyces syringium]|uniref:Asparagine synthase (Glutamine-hydrolyzing) n=1 Tax=Streptomyces syringium TaxID=76729 RepID=A0ABS4Y380_9ACTN|nr:asparagine synthase-related protein [Streptomyces syringium]MBP2403229.1 asparagine synthase (glutamine-hydrolyzing) [Streptomyces syringium]